MPVEINSSALAALRQQRQCLVRPAASPAEYEPLFRAMQPVAPVWASCPGDAPKLVHRAAFDDQEHNFDLRAERLIVKGRFQGGKVGYVFLDELALYAAAYRSASPLGPKELVLADLLRNEGPMTVQQMKESTGLLVKEITPALHKLQGAFLVYEDQVDNDWERGFYLLENEFPQVKLGDFYREEAMEQLARRVLKMNGFATAENIKDFTEWSKKDVDRTLAALAERGELVWGVYEGELGFLLKEDAGALETAGEPERQVLLLHRFDFLVKSHERFLKRRFPVENPLQYLWVDGAFGGVLTGRWKQGPHELHGIALAMEAAEMAVRREEICTAIHKVYGHFKEKSVEWSLIAKV